MLTRQLSEAGFGIEMTRAGLAFYDSQAWREIAEYRDFIEKSPLASLAAQLLETNRVNFFFDAVFVRTPGAQFRTPFHQDEPYWSVKGFDTCSIWMPLVSVEKKSALEFVRGSHRWASGVPPDKFWRSHIRCAGSAS